MGLLFAASDRYAATRERALFTSFTVCSSESEWTVTVERLGAEQATSASVLTRVPRTGGRCLVAALHHVLTGYCRRRQVNGKTANTQLQRIHNDTHTTFKR